jgi:hypothetical protein
VVAISRSAGGPGRRVRATALFAVLAVGAAWAAAPPADAAKKPVIHSTAFNNDQTDPTRIRIEIGVSRARSVRVRFSFAEYAGGPPSAPSFTLDLTRGTRRGPIKPWSAVTEKAKPSACYQARIVARNGAGKRVRRQRVCRFIETPEVPRAARPR